MSVLALFVQGVMSTTTTSDRGQLKLKGWLTGRGVGLRAVVITLGRPTPRPRALLEGLEWHVGGGLQGASQTTQLPPLLWPSVRQEQHPACCELSRNTPCIAFWKTLCCGWIENVLAGP
jgi:hypothetical protein